MDTGNKIIFLALSGFILLVIVAGLVDTYA